MTNIRAMVQKESWKGLRPKVCGKSILIASRYRPKVVNSVFSVIGYYVGEILSSIGARVTYDIVSPKYSIKGRYDIGIVCYYDNDIMVSRVKNYLNQFTRKTNKSYYYTNLVPCVTGFDKIFLSRQQYLNRSCQRYGVKPYRASRPFGRAVWIGRGADHLLLHPNKNNDFRILIDADRGPGCERLTKEAVALKKFLMGKGFRNIDVIGVGLKRMRHHRLAEYYNNSCVYISGLSGLYELPVIESQCAGNYVISYKGRLHNDLLCPKSSRVCHDHSSVLRSLHEIQDDYDPSVPRAFVLNGFRWVDVIKRMLKHL